MINRLILAAFILAACSPDSGKTLTVEETESSPQAPTSAPSSTPVMLLQGTGPDQAKVGRAVFLQTCAVCHGTQAEGYANDLAAPALDASEHTPEHPDPQIHDWIVNGKLGFDRQMPAYGDQLTDVEVHALIAFLHTLWTLDQLQVQQDLGFRWPATPEPTWTPLP